MDDNLKDSSETRAVGYENIVERFENLFADKKLRSSGLVDELTENYCQDKKLSPEEEQAVRSCFRQMQKDYVSYMDSCKGQEGKDAPKPFVPSLALKGMQESKKPELALNAAKK